LNNVRRPTVLIADDHQMVRQGLASLLADEFDVVATVGDGTSLLEEAARTRPDVIVTDVSMPGLSGMDALRRLKAQRADVKVILLTMHVSGELAAEAMRAGAAGFVVKQSAGEELVTAIREALQGHVYLTPSVTRATLAGLDDPRPEPLTPRQREVLRLVAQGRRMKEIAALLGLSPRTVETHKYEMMQALGVQSTAELIRYAIQNRLVED
jgi:DNA-binding NarL/FixJ family response regulator